MSTPARTPLDLLNVESLDSRRESERASLTAQIAKLEAQSAELEKLEADLRRGSYFDHEGSHRFLFAAAMACSSTVSMVNCAAMMARDRLKAIERGEP